MKNSIVSFALIATLALASCESTTENITPGTSSKGDRVFILDEGNFGSSNAHLDVYNWTTDSLHTNIVDPLGDVGNDLQLINGKLYAVLDNSSKVEVINPDSTSDRTSIAFPAGSAPAKIVQISATEALVPELYNAEIAVINLGTNMITSTIPVNGGQYSIAMLGGKAYSASSVGKLFAIDAITKTVIDSTTWLNANPSQVLADSANNALVVVTSGDYKTIPSKIQWVNSTTMQVTDSIVFSTAIGITTIFMGNGSIYVCYFGKNSQVINTITHTISDDPLLTKAYVGGYYDAAKQLLYMGTVSDYQHNDQVDIFDMASKSLKKSLTVGIAPSFFAVIH